MKIEYFLDLDYDSLIKILIEDKELSRKLLVNDNIKKKIINSPRKYDFIWLIQNHNVNFFPELLSGNGVEILKKTDDFVDKMNGILTSGNPSVSSLFYNDSFTKLVIDNISKLKDYLYGISGSAICKMLEYIKNNNLDTNMLDIIGHASSKVQEQVVRKFTFPSSILNSIMLNLDSGALEYLLNNDLRISTLNDLSFDKLFYIFSKGIHVPNALLEEKDFKEKLVSILEPKDYRFLVNALEANNDVDFLEKERKNFYEKEIKSYNIDNGMLERFYLSYLEICDLIDNNKVSWDEVEKIMKRNVNSFEYSSSWFSFIEGIINSSSNKDNLMNFFRKESNFLLTNMIIDYHFEDVYYNFLLDTKQLYRFQKTEGRTLTDKDIEIYEKILNLDKLSYYEKLSLFEELKKVNSLEKYYDDYRKAKDKAFSMIKEKILNSNNISKYRDEALSGEYGVDIYVLDGEQFYALVKSLEISKNFPLSRLEAEHYNVDGSSYSLDGSDKLNTFEDPREYYNLLYEDFSINQVVHMYPVDSFSKYIRNGKADLGTDRVFGLFTPEEFVRKSPDYNEIIYSQKNNCKRDELNEQLDVPKLLAIYCYDYFTKNDIESANNLGVGIVLVKTKNYNVIKTDDQVKLHDTTMFLGNNLERGINYLKNINQDSMTGRRK